MEKETDIFSGSPFANLSGASEPAWLWDIEGGAILWANSAGLAFWGAGDLASLKERRFDRAMPALSRLRCLCVANSELEPQRERLLFWGDEGNQDALCQFEDVQLGNGESGLLLRILDEGQGSGVNGAYSFAGSKGVSFAASIGDANGHVSYDADDRLTLQEIADQIRTAQGYDNGQVEPRDSLLSDIGQTDLFAKISHEVRTPLNSIIGFSDLMKEESFGPVGHEKYKGYVTDIHFSAHHALSLINDLLDISKIHAGEFELNPEDIEVNILIEQCVSSMEPIASKAEVDLHMASGQDIPMVNVDKQTLKQILLNLLSNAIKFTESGGVVNVSTFRGHLGTVTIRVEDSGVGMSEDEVVQAFKPFRQLDTAPRVQIGTGLGLPLARALSEANGALFDLTSEPGEGTRVDLVFKPSR